MRVSRYYNYIASTGAKQIKETKMNKNINIAYNADGASEFHSEFAKAYKTGVLCEELADMFTLTFLDGQNPDGTKRMIVNFA
jgi:hypothetical protein